MLFPAIFINVIQLTTKSLYFWDSLYSTNQTNSNHFQEWRKNFLITGHCIQRYPSKTDCCTEMKPVISIMAAKDMCADGKMAKWMDYGRSGIAMREKILKSISRMEFATVTKPIFHVTDGRLRCESGKMAK